MNTRQDIVEFIIRFHETFGYAPSVREVGRAVGLKSSSTVHHHLRALVAEGRIRFEPDAPRTLRVVQEA